MPIGRLYRFDLHNSGYSGMVCISGKADNKSAQLDFFAGLDFSLFIDGGDTVFALAELAEERGQGRTSVFCDPVGVEYLVVRDFFRPEIADAGFHRDNHTLAFYPADYDQSVSCYEGIRLPAPAIHPLG